MQTNCTHIPYKSTGYFSKLVLDYIDEKKELKNFYQHSVSLQGFESAIEQRKKYPTNRKILVNELTKQYKGITLNELQEKHLANLAEDNTFTICTAHQPNIFTGHLYFIYKILHAVKLAEALQAKFPQQNFVPIFYMGSEDADLDELGSIDLNGEKLKWKTDQTGAVGRMLVDNAFIQLIERISGELSVQPYGKELISLFKSAYTIGSSIQRATLILVNELFKDFGLIVLIPDNANLKRPFNKIVKKELTEQFSYPLIQETTQALSQNYKVQAGGREINLFYLVDNIRERITKSNGKFQVASFEWTLEEIINEVDEHPERFSANVILRGIFQEMMLPNIAFIGGGGEIAYWMELKKVFEVSLVPFPVLILRNSFLLMEKRHSERLQKLGLKKENIFKEERSLLLSLINRDTPGQINLDDELVQLTQYYQKVRQIANEIDPTLADHVSNLSKKAEKSLCALEKKMINSSIRKYEAEQRQIRKIKTDLFPGNTLQERKENFSPFHAKHGKAWIDAIYQCSLTIEQQFIIIEFEE